MVYNNKKGVLLVLSLVLLLFVILVVSKYSMVGKKPEPQTPIVTNDNLGQINNLLNSGKYEDVISFYENKGVVNLSRDEKIKLISAYLGKGNYFYKEDEYSKKSMDILNTMNDEYSTLYYKGYAQEIIKNYTDSLEYYNKGLELTDLSNIQKAVLLNQRGHLYDLTGDLEKANKDFQEANNLDKDNVDAISNLGRYFARTGDYKKSMLYFKQTLNKDLALPEKAEIYFTLSSLQLEIGGINPDIEKTIDYARKAVNSYSDYPMGYIAIAKGLYMKNDYKLNGEIKKNLDEAIKLNPNSSYAYELLGLLEYDNGNLEDFLNMFLKSESVIDDDMILMDNDKEKQKAYLNFKYYVLSEIEKNKEDTEGLYEFINNLLTMDSGKSIILQQIKREGHGIFKFLEGEEKFDLILSELKK